MAGNILKKRVVLVGIGGATCSGKTSLAKHLTRILPNSILIHQDDFAPPRELIPIHPIYNVEDWDAPQGAIDWPRFSTFLGRVKSEGVIPSDHWSHDHLNEQKDIHVSSDVVDRWIKCFEKIAEEEKEKGDTLVWGLVDGFLLYWDQGVIDQLDVRLFLRVPRDVLQQRRYERHGYHTAEGSLWRDPPHYWEQIVWPAYVEAHRDIFENGDVGHGKVSAGKVEHLILLEGMSMEDLVINSCEALKHCVRNILPEV